MQDKTLKDAYREIVDNQLESADPPETRATLERLITAGHDRGEAMQLIAAAVRIEMQATLEAGRPFDNALFVKRLAKLPQVD